MSMSDMSSRWPIGTEGSGMGVMVSFPYADEKAVLDFNKGGEMRRGGVQKQSRVETTHRPSNVSDVTFHSA